MTPSSGVVFLPCSDIQKTYAFYHELLRLPVAQKQADSLYIFDTGYGYWGFCQYPDGRPLLSGPKGVCLSLNLASDEEVDAYYDLVKEKAEVHQAPVLHPVYPVYSFFLKDPDGYLVEFQRVHDPKQELK